MLAENIEFIVPIEQSKYINVGALKDFNSMMLDIEGFLKGDTGTGGSSAIEIFSDFLRTGKDPESTPPHRRESTKAN